MSPLWKLLRKTAADDEWGHGLKKEKKFDLFCTAFILYHPSGLIFWVMSASICERTLNLTTVVKWMNKWRNGTQTSRPVVSSCSGWRRHSRAISIVVHIPDGSEHMHRRRESCMSMWRHTCAITIAISDCLTLVSWSDVWEQQKKKTEPGGYSSYWTLCVM